jgi:hypothetical protein
VQRTRVILEGTLLIGGLQLSLRGCRANLVASLLVSRLWKINVGDYADTHPENIVELGILDHCEVCLVVY